MPPEYLIEFPYIRVPRVPIRISSPETGRRFVDYAQIDTGADITILDSLISERLGIDLTNRESIQLTGVGGQAEEGRLVDIEISILANSHLTGTIQVAFMPDVGKRLANLIGLDFLSFIDFWISHANRMMYFGLPERP